MRRARWWYVATAVVLVAGLAGTTIALREAVAAWPGRPVAIGSGDIVRLERPGLSLYADRRYALDTCIVTDEAGRDVMMERHQDESIDAHGQRWYTVSRSVDPLPPGDYRVMCADDGYAVGPRASVARFALILLALLAALGVTGLLGAVLLAIGVVRQVRPRSPATST